MAIGVEAGAGAEGSGKPRVGTTFIKETPTYQGSTYHNTRAFIIGLSMLSEPIPMKEILENPSFHWIYYIIAIGGFHWALYYSVSLLLGILLGPLLFYFIATGYFIGMPIIVIGDFIGMPIILYHCCWVFHWDAYYSISLLLGISLGCLLFYIIAAGYFIGMPIILYHCF